MTGAALQHLLFVSVAHSLAGLWVAQSGSLLVDRFAFVCVGVSWFLAMFLAGWRMAAGAALSWARGALLAVLAGIFAHALFFILSFSLLAGSLGRTMMEQLLRLLLLTLVSTGVSLGLYGPPTLFCALLLALLLGWWGGQPVHLAEAAGG